MDRSVAENPDSRNLQELVHSLPTLPDLATRWSPTDLPTGKSSLRGAISQRVTDTHDVKGTAPWLSIEPRPWEGERVFAR